MTPLESLGGMLGAGFTLVSWWKALLFMPPFLAWAWLISTVYDKHAVRFHLSREKWNAGHLSAGVAAVLIGMFLPALIGLEGIAGFIVGWIAMILVLFGDVISYPMVANKDPRVPEEFRVRLNMDSFKEAREVKAAAKLAGTAELSIRKPNKKLVTVPARDDPEFATRVAAEQLVLKAMEIRASQLEILPASRDGAYAIRYIVDGMPQPGETYAPQDAAPIVEFWRGAAGMDLTDRRKQQTGMMSIGKDDHDTAVRVTAIGGSGGLKITMKFDPALSVRRNADNLGLLDSQRAALDALVNEQKGGLVLLASPPGQGRTTTLYTILKMHDAYTKNVQTLELETEDGIEGARQNVFDRFAEDQDFAKNLRSILRRDPDVVGVAELPDKDTAQETTRGDLPNARVYISLRAADAMAAVQVWVKAVGDLESASANLTGLIGNRLVRKLCDNCRVAYQPSPDLLKKLGLPADRVQQLFKKGGQVLIKNKPEVCPVCNGLGYAGQEGVFEVYPIGAEEREMLKAGNLQGLRAELRKKKHVTIQQAALRKAVEGITSIEEVLRVTAGEEAKKKPTPTQEPAPSGA